jgi:MFS transporter, DHA2 family, methylenomycin A resistance protein
VLAVMCFGYFLVLLDVTVVNVALPSISSGLDADVDGLQWIVDGYAVVLASTMLAGGTIGDLRGHKRVVLAGFAIFGAASLGCGMAPNVGILVGFRALQGLGAALLLPGTLAIITRAYPERGEQARAIGVWAGIGGAALPAGPVLGGLLVDGLGWRSVFLINVPIVIAVIAATSVFVAETKGDTKRNLDLPGTILGGVALAAITATLIEAGHGGFSPALLAGIALAVLAVAAFIRAERRADDPMLPLSLARRRSFAIPNATAGVMNLGTLGMLFVVTLYLQGVQGRSPTEAGISILPLFGPVALLGPFAGRLAARIGPRLPMAAGLLIAATGLAGLSMVNADTAYLPGVLVPLLAWGIGIGLLTPSVVAAAMRSVQSARAGLASAVNNTARQAGGAIGIAAFGAVAGAPGDGAFISGFHAAALIAACLYTATSVLVYSSAP